MLLDEVPGSHPAVYGVARGPAGSGRILLYAHHDVQPADDPSLWDSPPFEPVERDGRMFGRGTADDKAGIAVHAAALRMWEGKPPLELAVFIEGEEETGSPHLPSFIEKHRSLLRADAIVVADCSNWGIGQPTLTTSLRGIVDCVVEVRTLDHSVHSGKYGGAVPDALEEHLRVHLPWNAELTVTRERMGEPHRIDASGPAFDAFRRACTDTWDCLPVEPGSGGSLPLVAALADSYPDMALLLTGIDDPDSRAHSENESVHLGELKKCLVNETVLLGYMATESRG